MAHTRGPWRIDRRAYLAPELPPPENVVWISGEGWMQFACVIVRTGPDRKPDAEGEDNARLLAGADAALDALATLYRLHMHPTLDADDPAWTAALDAARVALRESTGRDPGPGPIESLFPPPGVSER